ncbi:malonate decarboxylase subunit alpha [Vibrio metschnikovii]|uniref:malonate decarboxylase subunit alpha n=1 Tax=Vibrio metschnikovii TaxID=28172 RepID=UPI00315D494F
MQIISAQEAASKIHNNSVIIPGGFGCCGFPDALSDAISDRYQSEQQPQNLTLLFASGGGNKAGKGLDKLAFPGLVSRAIGGFWGFCPDLTKMAIDGEIDAHNWPMGVVSHLFRSMAEGATGLLSRVGLGTFIDPAIGGGRLNTKSSSLIDEIEVMGKQYLHYPNIGVDFALLRGTRSDQYGNISMIGEAALHDAFWQAMAARNNGGRVIIQVTEVVDTLPKEEVDIPAHLVDFVVVDSSDYRPSYGFDISSQLPLSKAKELIIEEALTLPIPTGSFINFGIGIPAFVGKEVAKTRVDVHTSIESGIINGIPKEGLSFGEAETSQCIVQQSDLFSFYNGGGIDIAYLGFAEFDGLGNINASYFGDKITGVGGFINIALSAKKIVFCGTFNTNGLDVSESGGVITINREGRVNKFVERVQQITVNTKQPEFNNKEIYIITERASFQVKNGQFSLIKIKNGISAESILKQIPFKINVTI